MLICKAGIMRLMVLFIYMIVRKLITNEAGVMIGLFMKAPSSLKSRGCFFMEKKDFIF